MTSRGRVRLLHTSDIHVAGDEASRTGLRWAVGAAIDEAVDMVLIAGDLFDSSRVPAEAVDATLEQLARLRVPTIVIPGNHDCVDERSIYHRVDLRDAGPHVHFAADPAGETFLFPSLALAVWARGIEDHRPGHRPLEGYPARKGDLWRVAVTHGHFVTTREDTHRSSQIAPHEIAALDCDYLALGHWHRFVEVSEGGVTAAYCGSPSEGAGALVVVLDPDAGVSYERVGVKTP